MPRKLFIREEADKILKDWRDTWFIMADGNITQYNAIKALDVREFFTVYDAWRSKVQAQDNASKTKPKK